MSASEFCKRKTDERKTEGRFEIQTVMLWPWKATNVPRNEKSGKRKRVEEEKAKLSMGEVFEKKRLARKLTFHSRHSAFHTAVAVGAPQVRCTYTTSEVYIHHESSVSARTRNEYRKSSVKKRSRIHTSTRVLHDNRKPLRDPAIHPHSSLDVGE